MSGPVSGLTFGRNLRTIATGAGLLLLVWMLSRSSLLQYDENTSVDGTGRKPAVVPLIDHDLSHATPKLELEAEPPPAPEFTDNVAVIMETDASAVPNLSSIMLLFANILGPKWPVVLLTLESTWTPPESAPFQRLLSTGQIRIRFLPPNTTFPDHHSVSLFFTSPWIWEQFAAANRMLLFQADSVLCASSPLSVDDFAAYDLVGAPIASQHGVGYNGGLSLRNPRVFLEIARDPAHDFVADSGDGGWQIANDKKFEDQWFYNRLVERGAVLPDLEVARTFAVETVFHATPLGYHQPARWQQGNMGRILDWCPEVGMIGKTAQHFLSAAELAERAKQD